MQTGAILLGLAAAAAVAIGCGGDEGDATLVVSWTFDSGDCASNGVRTVRVTWGPEGGATQTVDFTCEDGSGRLGDVGDGGTFAITAEGLDASGAVLAESYGQTVTFGGGGTGGTPIEVHLHPAASDVTVSWSLADGGACPEGVILPYFVTLYVDPGAGELTEEVASAQESCSTGQVTLTGVAPGDYVVEVDSRAVTPALRATAPVTVVPGQDAEVAVQF